MRRKLQKIADPFWRDIENWPRVSVPEKYQSKFDRRKRLIVDYFSSDDPVESLLERHGFSSSHFHYLLDRAIEPDGEGGLIGWNGIIPNRRQKAYRRTTNSDRGRAGRFQQFLRAHPEISKKLELLYFSKRTEDRPAGGRVPESIILKEFHRFCVEAGILQHEYPLCLATGGREGLRGFLKRLDKQYAASSADKHGGQTAVTNLRATRAGALGRNKPPVPYAHVECDAHRLDLMMVVLIEDAVGTVEPYIIERAWLYVVQDQASRAVLGYYLSLNPEPGSEHFLQAIAHSLTPWKPKSLSIDGLTYPQDSGLPSGLINECAWRCFDRIRLDNALVHSSPWVQEQIMKSTGATVSIGRPRNPVARSCVERLFRTLNDRGWHRIGSTTGSKPSDPKRKDPGTYAKKHKITLEEVEELLDVIIAEYNISFHDGAPLYGKRSPLGYLEAFARSEESLPRTVRPEYRIHNPLYIRPVVRTVRGNRKSSVRPYVQYQNAIYRNNILDDAWNLIGKKIVLDLDITAAHSAPAHVVETGNDLHVLTARAPWSSPHSLRDRKAIMAKHKRGEFQLGTDAVRAFEKAKVKQAKQSKRAASAVARMHRRKTKSLPDAPPISIRPTSNQPDFRPVQRGWVRAGKAQPAGSYRRSRKKS